MSVFSTQLKAARCGYGAAVIVAGGSGVRFGGDKMTAVLAGIPVLAHTLLAFQRSEMIDEIVVVSRRDRIQAVYDLCHEYNITKAARVVAGGDTRAASCYAGVTAVSDRAELIAIHDGARPLVTEKVIEDAMWLAHKHTAAVPAVPMRDTIKQAEDGVVVATPPRSQLFAVQTPQCFQADIIRAALANAVQNQLDVTDDSMAVEAIGGKIFLSLGSEENIKITTPLDLALAEAMIARRETQCE
ncbi:MAG: 2-C-methyl-D-erythritol 4-phosphate cytidylyltransferase [Oscillospiraceae bacterium]|nr:2-C-methyl-D-erythritol 4-phosphate cytidylyltransferase [Oscillospiraceae bacterium]